MIELPAPKCAGSFVVSYVLTCRTVRWENRRMTTFMKDNRPGAFNKTGHYRDESGRWTIVHTRPKYWELRFDGIRIMGYTSFAAAKTGAFGGA